MPNHGEGRAERSRWARSDSLRDGVLQARRVDQNEKLDLRVIILLRNMGQD